MPNPFKHPNQDANSAQRRFTSVRLVITWIETLLGTLVMGGLTAAAMIMIGFHWTTGAAILALWILLPIIGWYHSANIVKRLTGCIPADPQNPQHQRLISIVDKLFPKTGLTKKPPVYVSPLKIPNAFATGRTPKEALIAATEGLLQLDLTDDEIETVLAHELAHVATYDVAINSLLAALGSLFSLILAAGLPGMFSPQVISTTRAPLLDELSTKVKARKRRFFLPAGGLLGFTMMMILFYLVSSFTKIVTLFVTRSRENAADALAVRWTGNPCALSMALQKIVVFAKDNPSDIRNGIITGGLIPLFLVNPFEEFHTSEKEKGDLLDAIWHWWGRLGENHPPIDERMKHLDRMSGGSCPRLF